MPYTISKRKGAKPYKIIKKLSGAVVASTKTKNMAKQAVKARYAATKSK